MLFRSALWPMNTNTDNLSSELDGIMAARTASDYDQALEAASDQRTLSERIIFAVLIVAIMLSGIFITRLRLLPIDTTAMAGIQITLLFVAALYSEVVHLRRRVNALTRLVTIARESGGVPDPALQRTASGGR